MAGQTFRLGDSRVPWKFERGDRVAWKKTNGSPDPHDRGIVDDGWCEREGNWFDEPQYRVCKEGGRMCFNARESELIKMK